MEMSLYRQIMEGRQELLDALNKGERSWSSVAAINIIFDGSTHISPNQACHAGLDNSYDGNKPRGAIAVVSALMKPAQAAMLNEEEAHYFLDWLLNESPYSSTFITKSADEALYYKAIISSAFHPSNLMAAGLVASRRLWEYSFIARVFVDLCQAGVQKDLAFYLAHIFSGRFDRGGNCSWGNASAGHCSMNPWVIGSEQLLNFLNHNVVAPNETYNKRRNYRGYDGMYGNGNHAVRHWIHDNFPYVGAKRLGGFFPADGGDDGKVCSYENLIEGMKDFQFKILGHIGYNKVEKAA